MIEYISLEMGVVRLTGGDVALFHLSQVFLFEIENDSLIFFSKGVAAGSRHLDSAQDGDVHASGPGSPSSGLCGEACTQEVARLAQQPAQVAGHGPVEPGCQHPK